MSIWSILLDYLYTNIRYMRAGGVLFYGILVLLAVMQISSACSTHRLDCPAYDSTMLKAWFPYSGGSRITFSGNGFDTLFIDQVSISQASSTNTNTSNATCTLYAGINGATRPGKLSFAIEDNRDDRRNGAISFRLGAFGFVADSLSDTGFVRPQQQLSVAHTNYKLGARTYARVQEIRAADSSAMLKVYLARGYGLVGYETSNHTLWTLP